MFAKAAVFIKHGSTMKTKTSGANEHRAIIDIVVTPRSSASEVRVEEGAVRVKLNSPPAEGKANEECIKLLSKALDVAKSSVRIVKGEKSRTKRIAVDGLSSEEAMARLAK